MAPEEMLPLIQEASGAFELYHVTTFQGYRKGKDGSTREVRVQVFD